jgi:hypothetical protein
MGDQSGYSLVTAEEFEVLRNDPDALLAKANACISGLLEELQSSKADKTLIELNSGES